MADISLADRFYLLGTGVALMNRHMLGTKGMKQKESCPFYAAPGTLSPGRRFFTGIARPDILDNFVLLQSSQSVII